jgi:signal peptidase II
LADSKRPSYRTLALLAIVALAVLAIDQLAKQWVVNNLELGVLTPVLGDLLQFFFVKNSGAAFSLASGMTWIFSIVASAVVVFIVLFAPKIKSVAWAVVFGLLLGGVLGNLTDRFFREPSFGLGHVIDFIKIWGFPAIFNLADVAIVTSMCLFVILTVLGIGLDGKRHKAEVATETPVDETAPTSTEH